MLPGHGCSLQLFLSLLSGHSPNLDEEAQELPLSKTSGVLIVAIEVSYLSVYVEKLHFL